MGPYVDAVVAVTVMRILLFVLHVCMYGSGGVVVERVSGLGLGITNPVGTWVC